MILTSFVHLISDLRGSQTVTTFHLSRVNSLTFKLPICYVLIERYVCGIGDKLFIKAMRAFSIGAMLAHPFHSCLFVLKIDLCAVEASASWTMVAFRF